MGGSVSALKDLDTVTKRLQYLSEFYPHREIFVFYSSGVRDVYTSRRLYTLAGRFAHRLRQHGFQKGDVIGNALKNSPERVITDLGIMLAGCVAMNIEPLLADGSDFLLCAKNSKCRAVVISSEKESPDWNMISKFICADSSKGFLPIRVGDAPDLTSAILIDRNDNDRGNDFLKDLSMSSEDILICPAESEDLLVVTTTSGSTGFSKLVPRTQREVLQLEKNFNNVRVHWKGLAGLPFKYYSEKSLGWLAGLVYGPISNGDTRVMLDLFKTEFTKTGKEMYEAYTKDDIEVALLLMSEIERINDHINSIGEQKQKLKIVFTGGQPVRKKQMDTFLGFAEEVIVVYGSTEVGVLTKNHIHRDDIIESNNSGSILDGVQLRVVSDGGKICKPYETGTVEAKGVCVFQGYFNRLQTPDPQTPQAFTSDGWFKTDDYGHMDKNGNLFIFGRTKDIIVFADDLVYPGWMEKQIMEHPDILEAFVVPVSDPLCYNNICACVKLTPDSNLDEKSLREFSENIFLPNLTDNVPIPKFFMITKEGFPETERGKINRQKLCQMAEEMFGSVKDADS